MSMYWLCVHVYWTFLPSFWSQCKHVFAVLSACDTVCNFSNSPDPPIPFKCPGMNAYKSALFSVREKVESDLTWGQILERFSLSCSKKRKHSKSYNKSFSDKTIPKKPKKEIAAEKSAQQIFLEKRKVVDLRKECERRGLITQGKKTEFVVRLM